MRDTEIGHAATHGTGDDSTPIWRSRYYSVLRCIWWCGVQRRSWYRNVVLCYGVADTEGWYGRGDGRSEHHTA
eukprot:909868-Rhodomonas_salina.1